MKTIQDYMQAINSGKENAKLIGVPFTAEYLAYWAGCSVRHAERMIQYHGG